MSLPIGRGGGLLKSIQNSLPTRTGRRRTNRFRDGTRFGPKKMFIASSFDLEKWANRRGYGLEHLEKLHETGVLQKILIGGAKGAQWQWYDNTTGWDRQTTERIGAIATKVGMKMEQDFWGRAHPVTLLQLKDNQVVQIKTKENDGYTAVQVGAGLKKLKNVTKPLMGHFARAGVSPKQKLVEFKVSDNAVVPVGTKIFAEHFKPGQFIDVRAKTRGKGFAGAMKRWGFSGLNASHGVSVSHRSLGSTGQRQDPGRTFRGKKMHGHMGVDFRTVRNLRIMKIDTKTQILYVIGKVPGPKLSWVVVRDAAWKKPTNPPPFPTFWRKPGLVLPRFLHWRFADPYKQTREIDWEQKIDEMVAALKAAQAAGEGEETGDAAAAGGADGGNLFAGDKK